MQLLEIKVKDLFLRESYKGKNREDQWSLAMSEGWKYHILSGCFRMKVVA